MKKFFLSLFACFLLLKPFYGVTHAFEISVESLLKLLEFMEKNKNMKPILTEKEKLYMSAGYLLGVIESKNSISFCVPLEKKEESFVAIESAIRTSKGDPEKLKQPAITLISNTLEKAFPCSAQVETFPASTPQITFTQSAPATPTGLNTPFKLGDFTYQIRSFEAKKQIGNEYLNYKAQDGAILIIVHYFVQNDSSETKFVGTDDFNLEDYKGRSFRRSTEATISYSSSVQKGFSSHQVQPGLKNKEVLVFEIPEDSYLNSGLKLTPNEKNFLGAEKITILLK